MYSDFGLKDSREYVVVILNVDEGYLFLCSLDGNYSPWL